MILSIAIAIVSWFIVMALTGFVVRTVGGGAIAVLLAQLVTIGGLAYALVAFGVVAPIIAAALVGAVLMLRVFALAYLQIMGKRALAGKMGEETQWAAELVRAEDEEFIEAMKGTPRMRLKEFSIMADTKDELRTLVVNHYEEDIKGEQ